MNFIESNYFKSLMQAAIAAASSERRAIPRQTETELLLYLGNYQNDLKNPEQIEDLLKAYREVLMEYSTEADKSQAAFVVFCTLLGILEQLQIVDKEKEKQELYPLFKHPLRQFFLDIAADHLGSSNPIWMFIKTTSSGQTFEE